MENGAASFEAAPPAGHRMGLVGRAIGAYANEPGRTLFGRFAGAHVRGHKRDGYCPYPVR